MKSKYVYVVGVYPPNHPELAGQRSPMRIKRTEAKRDGMQFWETRDECGRWLCDDILRQLKETYPIGTRKGRLIQRIEFMKDGAEDVATAIKFNNFAEVERAITKLIYLLRTTYTVSVASLDNPPPFKSGAGAWVADPAEGEYIEPFLPNRLPD